MRIFGLVLFLAGIGLVTYCLKQAANNPMLVISSAIGGALAIIGLFKILKEE